MAIDSFNAIKYTTSYGENCTATKKDGIVTIQGDKHGVHQMPLEEFMPAFIKDQSKVSLERTPAKDSVSLGSKAKKESDDKIYIDSKTISNLGNSFKYTKPGFFTGNYKMSGQNLDLDVKNGLTGRTIKGNFNGQDVDLKLSGTNMFNLAKGKILGTIGGNEIELKYNEDDNGMNLKGKINDANKNVIPLLSVLANDKIGYDVEQDQQMAAAAITTGMV